MTLFKDPKTGRLYVDNSGERPASAVETARAMERARKRPPWESMESRLSRSARADLQRERERTTRPRDEPAEVIDPVAQMRKIRKSLGTWTLEDEQELKAQLDVEANLSVGPNRILDTIRGEPAPVEPAGADYIAAKLDEVNAAARAKVIANQPDAAASAKLHAAELRWQSGAKADGAPKAPKR